MWTWKTSLKLVSTLILLASVMSACGGPRKKLCTDGGDPVREGGAPFRGTKKCTQVLDTFSNTFVNDGKYYEWYPSEKISVTGEYKMGKKTGRWMEYNEAGKKTSDKYFDDGKEVKAP